MQREAQAVVNHTERRDRPRKATPRRGQRPVKQRRAKHPGRPQFDRPGTRAPAFLTFVSFAGNYSLSFVGVGIADGVKRGQRSAFFAVPFRWRSNQAMMYRIFATWWLGRTVMPCGSSGTRTSTLSTPRIF